MSEIVDIHGTIKFIHALNMNKYGKWSVTIYPNEEGMKKIRALKEAGLKNEIKRDDQGDFITFHREPTKTMRGKVVAFPAPRVVGKDGKPMDGSKIGWGSTATIRLDVYKSGPKSMYKYMGARWDAIRIDELVEWEKEMLPAAEQEAHESLVKAEEPIW